MNKRGSSRHEVTIIGKYRSGTGMRREVTMMDISETGGRFHDRRTVLRVGSSISLRVDVLGPFDATVRWIDGDTIGVEFTQPIYGPVFEHIRDKLDNSTWRPPARL